MCVSVWQTSQWKRKEINLLSFLLLSAHLSKCPRWKQRTEEAEQINENRNLKQNNSNDHDDGDDGDDDGEEENNKRKKAHVE